MVKAPFVIKLALLEPEVLPKRIALEALPRAPLAADGAAAPTIKVPALIVVTPLYVFTAVKVREPEPDLVTAFAPEMTCPTVIFPRPVNVTDPFHAEVIEVKLNPQLVPEVAFSKIAPLDVTVNPRPAALSVNPEYLRVPPSIIRFVLSK